MVLILESGPIPTMRWRWQWLLGGLVRLGGEAMVTWAMQDNQPWGNCHRGMSVLKTFWPTSYMTAGSSPFTRCKLTSCLKRLPLDQLNSGKTEQQSGVSPAVLIFFAERCRASLSWPQIVFVRSTSVPACPMSRHRRRTGVEDMFCGFAVDGVRPAATLQQNPQLGWVKGTADEIQGWDDSQEAMSHQRASQNTNYSGLMQPYSLLIPKESQEHMDIVLPWWTIWCQTCEPSCWCYDGFASKQCAATIGQGKWLPDEWLMWASCWNSLFKSSTSKTLVIVLRQSDRHENVSLLRFQGFPQRAFECAYLDSKGRPNTHTTFSKAAQLRKSVRRRIHCHPCNFSFLIPWNGTNMT